MSPEPSYEEATKHPFANIANGKEDYIIFTTGLGENKINHLLETMAHLKIKPAENREMVLGTAIMPIIRIPFAEMMPYAKYMREFEKDITHVRPVEHGNERSWINRTIREEEAHKKGDYEFFREAPPQSPPQL